MSNTLHIICPTDFLETEINRQFGGENYFFTSLAISSSFEDLLIHHLAKTIDKKRIHRIVLSLRDDNKVINQHQSSKRNNDDLQSMGKLGTYRTQSMSLWNIRDKRFLFISHLLNSQLSHLQARLAYFGYTNLEFEALIYNSQDCTFSSTYNDIIFSTANTLN